MQNEVTGDRRFSAVIPEKLMLKLEELADNQGVTTVQLLRDAAQVMVAAKVFQKDLYSEYFGSLSDFILRALGVFVFVVREQSNGGVLYVRRVMERRLK